MYRNMSIKKLLISLCLLFSISIVRAQQYTVDPGKLAGEWQLDKVEVKTFSQADHQLLKQSTYTPADSANKLTAYIPLFISFYRERCIVKTGHSAEAGNYTLTDSLFTFERPDFQHSISPAKTTGNSGKPSVPGVSFGYRKPSADKLILKSRDLFSQDMQHNVAVSEVYLCFYSRKKG